MEILDRPEPSKQFIEERQQAMLHIQRIFDNLNASLKDESKCFRWVKTELSYPSFDDFTFAYRNKIFSVLVEIADIINGKASFGNEQRVRTLLYECQNNNLTPCIYPVIKNKSGGYTFWGNIIEGLAPWGCWNLMNAVTQKFVDPVAEASDELVEVSEWEFQNWAVEIVKEHIQNKGLKLFSYCDVLGVEPNIWFENDKGKTCWVEVLHTLYHDNDKSFSFSNWPPEVLKYDGYKAVVGFANADDITNKLYRNQPAFINFKDLQQIYSAENKGFFRRFFKKH